MPPKASPKAAASSSGSPDVATNSSNPLVAPPDETAIRQSAVVSSTFANVELQTTRQTLKQYVQLFDESRDENQRLTSELVERDKDSMKVVQFLRAELDGKVADMANVQQQHKLAVDKLRSDFHNERKQLLAEINERDDAIASLQNQNSTVRGDLEALQTFAMDRDRLYAEMTAFREQHKRECEAYEKEISRLRFVSLEEKVRVKAEERMMTEKFEAEVSDRAMKLLDIKTREIHNENFALLQDKVLLEEELDRLIEENKGMKQTTSSQKRDVDLAKVADEEYSKRGARQAREIKDLRNQCKLMEANIAKLIDEYEHKLEVQSHKSQSEIDKLKEERDLSYRNAETRHKELVKMRQLSKNIVRQRSELEMFFNEALEHVRQQIVLERQQAIQQKFYVAQPNLQRVAAGGVPSQLPAVASSQERLLISDQGVRPPQQQGQHPASSGSQHRGGSALVASDHPFFQGGGKEFDSIYQAGDDGGSGGGMVAPGGGVGVGSAVPSHRSSAQQLPRLPSNHGLPAIKASAQGKHPLGAARNPPPAPPERNAVVGAAATTLSTSTDIAHLSWNDKERVLRILLAKINNAARYERKEHADLQSGGLQVLAPPVPKQIATTTKSDTFLTQCE